MTLRLVCRVRTLGGAAVNIIYGSTNGLQGEGSWYVSRATPGIAGDPKNGDRLEEALAAGNVVSTISQILRLVRPAESMLSLSSKTLQIVPDPGSVHVRLAAHWASPQPPSRLINGSIAPLGAGNFGSLWLCEFWAASRPLI
jgi:hypothetical protein